MTPGEQEAARQATSSRAAAGSLRAPDTGSSAPDPRSWLAAIVDGSADAIISENLNGIIQSWNGGATRLFGYQADEVIGKPIAILIPEDRLAEEPAILLQIQCGKCMAPFETQRRHRNGALLDVSLTVSLIRNQDGVMIGVSSIVRDIAGKRIAQEQQRLLMGEMHHRMKNLFALADAIVSISARSSGSEDEVINDIRGRLSSLARAHSLSMDDYPHDAGYRQAAPLLPLIHRILDPYAVDGRVTIGGASCDVSGHAVIYLTRLLYELAANAAKFGSLSVGSGQIEISVVSDGDIIRLVWQETGGPVPLAGGPAGFGSRLERGLTSALHATIHRDWRRTGLVITIAIPRAVLAG